MYYTKEQIDIANNSDILDIARYMNMEYKKISSNEYKLPGYGGLIVNDKENLWFCFSENMGGKAINFVKRYAGMNFADSVDYIYKNILCKEIEYNNFNPQKKSQQNEHVEINLNDDNMKHNYTYKNMYAYLIQTRKINKKVIDYFVKKGLIFQNRKGGIVFLGKDKDGIIKYASIRGASNYSNFKQEALGSNKAYSFNLENKRSNSLVVFESAIDMLSYIIIQLSINENYLEYPENLLSLGGVNDMALNRFLSDNPQIRKIEFALDNDSVGTQAIEYFKEKYKSNFILSRTIFEGKDINEYLKYLEEQTSTKGIEKDYIIKDEKLEEISKNLIFTGHIGIHHYIKDIDKLPDCLTDKEKKENRAKIFKLMMAYNDYKELNKDSYKRVIENFEKMEDIDETTFSISDEYYSVSNYEYLAELIGVIEDSNIVLNQIGNENEIFGGWNKLDFDELITNIVLINVTEELKLALSKNIKDYLESFCMLDREKYTSSQIRSMVYEASFIAERISAEIIDRYKKYENENISTQKKEKIEIGEDNGIDKQEYESEDYYENDIEREYVEDNDENKEEEKYIQLPVEYYKKDLEVMFDENGDGRLIPCIVDSVSLEERGVSFITLKTGDNSKTQLMFLKEDRVVEEIYIEKDKLEKMKEDYKKHEEQETLEEQKKNENSNEKKSLEKIDGLIKDIEEEMEI